MSTNPASTTIVQSDLTDARRIVHEGLGALDALARESDAAGTGAGPWRVGSVWAWSLAERDQLEAFRGLIEDYLQLEAPPRPLCLAVFGQPGSGKSHAVRAFSDALAKDPACAVSLPFFELNLTQLPDPQLLSQSLRDAAMVAIALAATDRAVVPVVFFDEFDAPLQGTPLGWLGWLLAPMQDGEFRDGREPIMLKRAIYVFAGGTADRLSEFGAQNPGAFRRAKGPDFVSRLRGHIDVLGPNTPSRQAERRAVLLRTGLEKVEEAQTARKAGPRPIDAALLEDLLRAGRYRHGARSIHAVLELAAARSARGNPPAPLSAADLPGAGVLAHHVDLGPLDTRLVGGPVALSGGGASTEPVGPDGVPAPRDALWLALAHAVWMLGGVVSYGGHAARSGLTDLLAGATATLPRRLGEQGEPERMAWYDAPGPNDAPAPAWKGGSAISVVPVPYGEGYGPRPPLPPELLHAVQLFHMRWRQTNTAIARVVLAGRTGEERPPYEGRMPPVLEDAVLSLAVGRPLYVIGALGGAAEVVGRGLGLARGTRATVVTGPAWALVDLVRGHAEAFRPGGRVDLPLTTQDALDTLATYAIGGSHWVDNGLSVAENRELFEVRLDDGVTGEEAAARVARIVDLVTIGLTRCFSRA